MATMVECILPDGSRRMLPSDCYYASAAYRDARSEAIRDQQRENRMFAVGASNSVRNVNWGNQFRNLPRVGNG